MTARQKVKAIFPNACLEHYAMKYFVAAWDEMPPNKFLGPDFYKTPTSAWSAAWKDIQHKMLKKLAI
jgi:hypothetical protein